jgi:hypothetical protein
MNSLLKPMLLLASFLLTACTENPLQKQSTQDLARLLSEASVTAMKNLGFKELGMSDRYAKCMEHRTSPFFNCEGLYQAMTEVFKAHEIKVRTSQLTDKKLYERVKEELNQRSYFSL